ncbi:MAG: hypothetical protein IT371_24035 [Deltaproteobacteria bacterium]|nr:hypothetical protein [Deltaproteobacteria bacterium]
MAYVAIVVLLAAAPVLGVLALRSGGAALRAGRLLRTLGGARREGYGRLGAGRVAVIGRIQPIDLLTAPGSRRSAVYVAHALDQWEARGAVVGAGGSWVRVAQLEEAAPFELSDGQLAFLVDPTGAEVVAPTRAFSEIPDGGPPLRHSEGVLEPGREVFVAGWLRHEAGGEPSALYRGDTVRRVLAASPDQPLFVTPLAGARCRLALVLAQGALAGAVACVGLGLSLYGAARLLRGLLP